MTKILVVDDSEIMRKELNATLSQANYKVIEAADGLDGLEKLKENPDTELIIVDINMPLLNGMEMCAEIRRTNKSVKIFVVSLESSSELKAKGKAIGVMAWINKPVHPDKLLLAVKKALQSA